MDQIINIATEGVLVLASAQALKEAYKDNAFDYDFPEGLSDLLKTHAIIALTTSDGDNLLIEFTERSAGSQEEVDKEIYQLISLASKDALLVLSHAEFTQICDQQGNVETYRWPVKKIENVEAGMYEVRIKVKNTSREFEKYGAYFKLSISMKKAKGISTRNKVIEISE